MDERAALGPGEGQLVEFFGKSRLAEDHAAARAATFYASWW
jgi:hypothetical protein